MVYSDRKPCTTQAPVCELQRNLWTSEGAHSCKLPSRFLFQPLGTRFFKNKWKLRKLLNLIYVGNVYKVLCGNVIVLTYILAMVKMMEEIGRYVTYILFKSLQ